MTDQHYDIIIIGTGAAGLSAAVYAGRYNMKALVIGAEFGGETAKAGSVENWPGDIGVDGYDLMSRMKKHAEHVGAKVIDDEALSVTPAGTCFAVKTREGEYHATNIVFAQGSRRRRLGLQNEEELTGNGVHFCVTCDGPVYAGKTIALVGGGDAAAKGAHLVAEYVNKVYVIVRKDKMRAEPVNVERLVNMPEKITILYNAEVKEIKKTPEGKFGGITLTRDHKQTPDLPIDGLFIEVGADPNVGLAKAASVALDEAGHIETDNMMQTNVPGLYAAGDIVAHFGHFKQDITASAMGAVAATSAYAHFKEHAEKGGCKHEN